MTTEYRVTLYRKENGEMPVITPCNLHEHQYYFILRMIEEKQKELTLNRNAGKKYEKMKTNISVGAESY